MITVTTRLSVILAATVAVTAPGCDLTAEEEPLLEDELGFVDQEAACSYSCGGWRNGIRQAAWNHVAGGAVFPSSLSSYGAGNSTGPYSICQSWLPGGACVVREGWIKWATNNYTNGTTRTLRTEVFLKMLAIIGEPGQLYYDLIESNGSYYEIGTEGAWGLAPHALSYKWSYKDMELVTAGLILMLNENGVNVEVMLRAEGVAVPSEQPDPAGYKYEESVAYGNIFRYAHTGISGGYDARNPSRDARFANMQPTSAHDVFHRDDGRCYFSGGGVRNHNRVATYCRDQYNRTWTWPVVARVRTAPSNWYLPGTGTVTNPGGGTKVVP